MPAPPAWLKKLADDVALQISPSEVLSPIGCHFCCVEGVWEVTLFASSTQIVGGKRDGVLRSSRFNVDLRAISDLFARVDSVQWQALPLGPTDELGPHVSLEGTYEGNPVWLRILSKAPKRFKPGRRAVVYEAAWEEIW